MTHSARRLPGLLARLTLCAAFASLTAQAQTLPTARQDMGVLRMLAEQFLHTQTTALPGQTRATVAAPDRRITLAACDAPQAFLPDHARLTGNTTVGLRCSGPLAWIIYLPAKVSVLTDYVSSAQPLAQGQVLQAQDILMKQGDLASLPAGVLTDATQAIGRSLSQPLSAGMPLRRDALRNLAVVYQGQTVRIIASGAGFSISGEARALTMGLEGQLVQARTASGQLVSGVAQAGGVLAVSF